MACKQVGCVEPSSGSVAAGSVKGGGRRLHVQCSQVCFVFFRCGNTWRWPDAACCFAKATSMSSSIQLAARLLWVLAK